MRRRRRSLALLLVGGVLLVAIAPLVSGWQRLPRNRPSAAAGSGQNLGVPILPGVLSGARMAVEIAWGAVPTNPAAGWAWTDVTTDVRLADGRKVSISVGRQDETSVAQPASCAFELDNTDGRYSAFNPLSSNWPNVVRNTPIRVRVSLDAGISWYVRFQGYANGFTPSWDASANLAVVTVSASGITRRLAQGKTPLRSALERAIVADAPLAYWPLEDGRYVTQVNSPVSGVPPLEEFVDGGFGYGLPLFDSLDTVKGSDSLPDFSNGAYITNRAAQISGGTAGASGWTADVVINLGTDSTNPVGTFLIMKVFTGVDDFYISVDTAASKWQITYQTNSESTGISPINPTWASTINPFDGNAHMLRLQATQSGANIAVTFTVDGTSVSTGTVNTATLKAITSVRVGTFGGGSPNPAAIGHVAVWNGTSVADHTGAMNGNQGETPAARMTRLCAEEGVPFETVGYYATDTTMGPQTVDTFLNLLRECEATDAGFLYDGLSAGLSYQGVSQRYDQSVSMTLDAAAGDIDDPFMPVDDDQRNRNLVKVDRKNGSSASAEQVDGPLGTATIGVYDDQVTVNPVDDTRLAFRASWEVHAGTIEGLRYPVLNLDLAARPTVASAWLNNTNGWGGAVLPGSRADVTNISSVATQHPVGTVPLMLEGYAEDISPVLWAVAGNCVNNRIYDVFKIGDSQLGRVQTGGSYLTADAAAGATSLTVASTGVIWTTTATNAGDFPLSVEVDGIQVTVTAISGTSSPQTFTVTGATVTKPLLAGKAVKVWHNGVIKF